MRLIWLLPLLLCTAADDTDAPKEIPQGFTMLRCDAMGRVYAIGQDEIFAFDEHGNERFRQSAKLTGEVSFLDPMGGLRLMTYYADQNTVRYLDNTLSFHQDPVDLGELGFPGATLVCASFRGNALWLYDASSQALVRIAPDGSELSRTENLLGLVGGDFDPVYMVERNESLYLADANRGIWVFDQFGVFMRLIEAKGVRSIQPLQEQVLWLADDGIHAYSRANFTDTLWHAADGIRSFCVTSGGMLWYSSDSLTRLTPLEGN